MKITFVLHQFLPLHRTGTENYAFQLGKCLLGKGHEVRVFTFERALKGEGRGLRFKEDPLDGLRVSRVFFPAHLFPAPILTEYCNPVLGSFFGKYLEDTSPEVVHFFHCMNLGASLIHEVHGKGIPIFVNLMDFWFLCPGALLLGRDGEFCEGSPDPQKCVACNAEKDGNYAHVQSLLEEHEGGGLSLLREKPFWQIEPSSRDPQEYLHVVGERRAYLKESLLLADGIISPSKFLKEVFVRSGFPEKRILRVPYGIDPGLFAEEPGKIQWRGSIRFGYMGSLSPHKGVRLLVDAFRSFPGKEVELWIYGTLGGKSSFEKELEGEIAKDSRIQLKGSFVHEEVGRILENLDFLVVPSLWYENTPFVVLEALASRTPVIASDTPGISELVRHGRNGLLFKRGDGAHLIQMLKQAAAKKDAPGWGIEDAYRIPTIEENVERFLELYEGAKLRRKMGTPLEESKSVHMKDLEKKNRDFFQQVLFLSGIIEEMGGEKASGGYRLVADLKKSLEECTDVLREREEDLEGHKKTLEVLRSELEGHRRMVSDLGVEKASQEVFIEEVKKEIAEFRKVSKEKDRVIEGYTEKCSVLEKDLEGHRRRKDHLERDLEGHKKKVADLEQDLEGHRRKVNDLLRNLEAARMAVAEKQETIHHLREESHHLREESHHLREESHRLREESHRFREESHRFREESHRFREESCRLREDSPRLQEKISMLTQELEGVKGQLEKTLSLWFIRPLRRMIENRIREGEYPAKQQGNWRNRKEEREEKQAR